ncbi:MAG: arylsulfatase [Sphingobacteriia bacterium]|jgi:arylsulfatase
MKYSFKLLPLLVLLITLNAVAQKKSDTPKSTIQTTGKPGSPSATTTIKGDILPAPDGKFEGVINQKASASTPAWPARIVPPKGAPNVLLILLDDVGFGAPSTFGGVVPTPALDRVAQHGVKYTNFHTTALCSPTRAALITGRNHHVGGAGVVGEAITGFPGYNSILRKENGTIGRILKEHGYATSWFGKNHNTPSYMSTKAGPFNQWPNGLGFDYFYGFMGGDASQWEPNLYQNTTPIYPFQGKEGWNLTTAMADEAIKYMKELKEVAPEKPFFVYYAPGGTHAPHHPTPEWIKKISDMHLFDKGWNKLRETIFENQKRLGIMPQNAKLTEWPKELPEWNSKSDLEKKLFIKQMDVYAAYLAYTDNEIGRVIQSIQDIGQLDNTLIIYISGDNGPSSEGMLDGTPNEFTFFNAVPVPVKAQMAWYPFWGSSKTFPHYAAEWAWSMSTPFKWVKQVASHFGGTAQGVAMQWPGHIQDQGGIRRQFHHVIDIVPTILEATGIPAPSMIDGVKQRAVEGTSMAYTWNKNNAQTPTTHNTQYFEMLGNRAIYNNGWVAATTPANLPWASSTDTPPDVIDGYKWELYNVMEDPTQSTDLAAQMPAKLEELKKLYYAEAQKYDVQPFDNTSLTRFQAPKPNQTQGRTVFTYTGTHTNISNPGAPNIMNKSYTITAEVTIPKGGGEGMIVTNGGLFGGYALFISKGFDWWSHADWFRNIALIFLGLGLLLVWYGNKNNWGKFIMFSSKTVLTISALLLASVFITSIFNVGGGRPVFIYNLLNLKRTTWSGSSLSAGKHTIVFDFKSDGPELGKGGVGILSVDGKEVARNSMEHTTPITFPIDESFDVGDDTRSGVSMLKYAYHVPFPFTGKIDKLTFVLKPASATAEQKQTMSKEDVKQISTVTDSVGVEN